MSSTRFWRAFGGDKPPFFLAIFFAALAWSLTRYADSLAVTPVIEYDITRTKNEVSVDLENLTRDKTFPGLIFIIRTTSGNISTPKIKPTDPAWEGRVRPSNAGQSATYELADFQPGWKYRLSATLDANAVPILQLAQSSKTVRLLALSPETWVIRHQDGLLVGLLFIWAAITTLMLLKGVEDDKTPSAADGGLSLPSFTNDSRSGGKQA